MMKLVLGVVSFLAVLHVTEASWADRHPYFKKCVTICEDSEMQCLVSLAARTDIAKSVDAIFGWNCADECRRLCMWNFTSFFVQKNKLVPKFYGRWPLTRYMGMLEPASALASFVTFASTCVGFWWLLNHCHQATPFMWCYKTIMLVNSFTWLSSTLFHIRDLAIFERMDYYGAFLTIFVPLFWFICRNFYVHFRALCYSSLVMILCCFVADVFYMEFVKFDHSLHHHVCTIIVMVELLLWFIWVAVSFKMVPHSRYYLLTFGSVIVGPLISKYFEWQPPFGWVYDAHSLFHISTIPAPLFFWWTVAIDDVYMTNELKIKSL